jgi:hypothetical protein
MSTHNERNHLIKEILQYDPTIKLVTSSNHKVFFEMRTHRIEITPVLTVDAVKRLIDNTRQSPISNYCSLCMETDPRIRTLGCYECSQFFCELCFLKMYWKSKGTIHCPYCRQEAISATLSEDDVISHMMGLMSFYKEINIYEYVVDQITEYMKI